MIANPVGKPKLLTSAWINKELFQQQVPFYGIMEGEISTPLELFDQYILPELAYPRLKFGLQYYLKLR